MAGLALASEPIIRLLYGPVWLRTAPLLAMIALTEIMLIALPLVSDLPILAGKLNQLLARNLVDTAASVILLALGTHWGVEGAAASRLIYAVFWYALYFRFMHRIVGFDRVSLMMIYLRSGLASLAAIVPLALTYALWAPPATITLVQLGGATVGGGLCWLIALALLRHPVLGEMLGMASALPVVHRCIPIRFRAA
jgi:O-antigen/teichoic acid export membrane protein